MLLDNLPSAVPSRRRRHLRSPRGVIEPRRSAQIFVSGARQGYPQICCPYQGSQGYVLDLEDDDSGANLLDSITGELTLAIPSFLTVNHDATSQKTTLSVLNPEMPEQRAMWGTCLLSRSTHAR